MSGRWYDPEEFGRQLSWFFAWLCFGFLLGICCSCGAYAPSGAGGADGGNAPAAAEAAFDGGPSPPGAGGLPFGYYQRQCQWDACGGPLPDRSPALDPPPAQ